MSRLALRRRPKLKTGTSLLWVGTVVPLSTVAFGALQPEVICVLTLVVVV